VKVRINHRRTITAADLAAAALLREGFARLRAQQVSSAGTGAPGSVDLVPAEHASDPATEPMREPK
jgi:hypothetical protein